MRVTLLLFSGSSRSMSDMSIMFWSHSSTVASASGCRSPLRISASHRSLNSCIELSSSSMLPSAEAASGELSAR